MVYISVVQSLSCLFMLFPAHCKCNKNSLAQPIKEVYHYLLGSFEITKNSIQYPVDQMNWNTRMGNASL